MSTIYKGVGVLLNDELVWSELGEWSEARQNFAAMIRDRHHPQGKVVVWAQSIDTPTVYRVIEEK